MSLTATLSNAYSGLSAFARSAEIVSDNVSNTMTEGYHVRNVELSHATSSGGVSARDIDRQQDPAAWKAFLDSSAIGAFHSAGADVLAPLAESLGGDGGLQDRLQDFENRLLAARGQPDSTAALDEVVRSAGLVVDSFREISSVATTIVQQTQTRLAGTVENVNRALTEFADIHLALRGLGENDPVRLGLMDRQQQLVEEISRAIPIIPRIQPDGTMSLFTQQGQILFHDSARELKLSGNTVQFADESGLKPATAGEIASLQHALDIDLVDFQSQLDAAAFHFGERFQAVGVDPTAGATDPGMFTDAGSRLSTGAIAGLASRLSLHSALENPTSGASWKLVAGLYATSPAEAADPQQLERFGVALREATTAPSGADFIRPVNPTNLAAEIANRWAGKHEHVEQRRVSEGVKTESFRNQYLSATGVNSDDEMQKLLQIESAYAANAKVLSAADQMLKLLLEV